MEKENFYCPACGFRFVLDKPGEEEDKKAKCPLCQGEGKPLSELKAEDEYPPDLLKCG